MWDTFLGANEENPKAGGRGQKPRSSGAFGSFSRMESTKTGPLALRKMPSEPRCGHLAMRYSHSGFGYHATKMGPRGPMQANRGQTHGKTAAGTLLKWIRSVNQATEPHRHKPQSGWVPFLLRWGHYVPARGTPKHLGLNQAKIRQQGPTDGERVLQSERPAPKIVLLSPIQRFTGPKKGVSPFSGILVLVACCLLLIACRCTSPPEY